jgi:hydroxyethylthiazole kinase
MAYVTEEMEELVALSGALVVDIGELSSAWLGSMRLGAAKARDLGHRTTGRGW